MTDILGFGVSSTSFSLTSPQNSLVEERVGSMDYMKRYRENNNEYQDNFDDVHRLVICEAKFSRFFGITSKTRFGTNRR